MRQLGDMCDQQFIGEASTLKPRSFSSLGGYLM